MSKSATLLLITVLVLSSLVMVGPASAQSTAKPSVPEFTIRYADYSYKVPPKYTIDQYTGQERAISMGYDVVNRTVHFTIKNQPFTPYTDSNGNDITLYYRIRYKGYYGDDWSDRTYKEDEDDFIKFYDSLVYPASNSSYSEILVSKYYTVSGQTGGKIDIANLPEQGLVDFQVQALIGKATLVTIDDRISGIRMHYYKFTGELGDWSDTQTISIPDGTVYTSNSPNQPLTPTVTASPTQNITSTFSTSTTVQLTFGGVFLVLTREQITIALIATVAILLVIIAVLVRKTTTKKPPIPHRSKGSPHL